MSNESADGFNKEMILNGKKALDECGYDARIFIQMIKDKGGVETAKSLLCSNEHQNELILLYMKKRLDLSMEALVLKTPWSALFTKEELDVARKRLETLEYLKEQ